MTTSRAAAGRRTDEREHAALRPATLRVARVRPAGRSARGHRARCARRATRTSTRTRRTRSTGWRRRWGSSAAKIPTIVLCGGHRRRAHRLLDDVLHERDRLPDQRRQPTAPQPAREHPDHLRAGGAAGRRARRSSACSPCSAAAPVSPGLRVGELLAAPRSTRFFLSVELPPDEDADRAMADVRRRRAPPTSQVVTESER